MSNVTTVRSGLARLLKRQRRSAEPSLRFGWIPLTRHDNNDGGITSQKPFCLPHAQRRRWQSNGTGTAGATPDIPAPTWSVANLRLKSDPSNANDIISEEELYKLAYRCLIDVRTLPQEERDALRRDLAGIMRCVSVVSDASQQISERLGGADIGPEELYDAFRGQYRDGAPLRDDSVTNEDNNGDAPMEEWSGKEEAQLILKNALKSGKRSICKDEAGDTYFSATTGGGSSG
jgi:hypothetical protein